MPRATTARTSKSTPTTDSTPTHSYLKFLYKYPQAAYPYVELKLLLNLTW